MRSNTFRKVISKRKIWITTIVFALFLFILMLQADVYDSTILRIQTLKADVISLNLAQGLNSNLLSKLDVALRLASDNNQNNDSAVSHIMGAFINVVAAHSGNDIPPDIAADLTLDAEHVIWEISGGTCPICGGAVCLPPCPNAYNVCPYCGQNPCLPPCDGTGGSGGL